MFKCGVSDVSPLFTEGGVRQPPCRGAVHHPLHLVPGHLPRSPLRGHPVPLEKLAGCLLRQVHRGEGTGRRLLQAHPPKLAIPRHPSSRAAQGRAVSLCLQGGLLGKVKIWFVKLGSNPRPLGAEWSLSVACFAVSPDVLR